MHQKWLILSAVACGTFMATLDSSIVNVALPSITQSFHTGISSSRWVVIAYLFSITGLLLFFGKLADVVGRKTIFNIGYIIFTIGSLTCGLSNTIGELIFFRGLQGFGSAMLMANGPAIITAAFPSNERGKALGTLAMVVSVGLALGPTLGGILVRLFDWRSIFFVNIPVGILGTYLAYKFIPASISIFYGTVDTSNDDSLTPLQVFERERKLPFFVKMQLIINRLRSFDWIGAIMWLLIQVGYSLLLDRENILNLSIPLQKILSFSNVGLLAMFIIWEWGIKDPILDLTLFKSKVFLFSNLSGLFNFVALSSITLLMPFYLQNVRGLEPHQVGLYMTMIPLTIFIIAPISGRLSDKYGSRTLSTVGMFFICLSMLLIAIAPNGIAAQETHGLFYYLILVGIGIGLFQSPNNNAIMGSVLRGQLGVASALLATVRNFGLVTGVAISTTILMYFFSQYTLANGVNTSPAENFISSLRITFVILAVFCSFGILTSLVKDPKIRS